MIDRNGNKFELGAEVNFANIKQVMLDGYPEPTIMSLDEYLFRSDSGEFLRPIIKVKIAGDPNSEFLKEDFWTFAKSWEIWDAETEIWYPVRIGTGAYGDGQGWNRKVVASRFIPNYGRGVA